MTLFSIIAFGLIVLKWAAELWLDRLNRGHVLAHADAVPEAFRDTLDAPTYAKSVQYTLAKLRFEDLETSWNSLVLIGVLFSGLLPWGYRWFTHGLGNTAWVLALFLVATGLALSLPGLPWSWHAQFRLEERFGFNTTKPAVWWMDRLKGAVLGALLGYPLIALILKLVDWTGAWWWLWAWGCVTAFQLVMIVLAPALILPLFNKFTPLPEGALRDRLLQLAERTGFRARSIQVMDGSRRSRHSNAFFAGFGKFRKIVLYDTLIAQLGEEELAAVLAHEIGHYRKRHTVKLFLWGAVNTLAAFWLMALLARQEFFYRAFGFEPGSIAVALLLFVLLQGVVTFWMSPLINRWVRRYEYEADAFAARALAEVKSLTGALRKLSEKNLSNLTPHPLYSGFYYSHPTLLEREQALRALQLG